MSSFSSNYDNPIRVNNTSLPITPHCHHVVRLSPPSAKRQRTARSLARSLADMNTHMTMLPRDAPTMMASWAGARRRGGEEEHLHFKRSDTKRKARQRTNERTAILEQNSFSLLPPRSAADSSKVSSVRRRRRRPRGTRGEEEAAAGLSDGDDKASLPSVRVRGPAVRPSVPSSDRPHCAGQATSHRRVGKQFRFGLFGRNHRRAGGGGCGGSGVR